MNQEASAYNRLTLRLQHGNLQLMTWPHDESSARALLLILDHFAEDREAMYEVVVFGDRGATWTRFVSLLATKPRLLGAWRLVLWASLEASAFDREPSKLLPAPPL